jgi:hypothetical protein
VDAVHRRPRPRPMNRAAWFTMHRTPWTRAHFQNPVSDVAPCEADTCLGPAQPRPAHIRPWPGPPRPDLSPVRD